jgi:hypothetical protein
MAGFNLPRTKFGSVAAPTFIMFLKSGLKIIRQAGIYLVWMAQTSQAIDVVKSFI